jgi:hypothetical protein
MFALTFLRRAPPKIITAAFYYGLPVILLLRFLVSTIWGVLLLSATAYWFAWFIGDPKPFTLPELALLVDELPSESKTSVVTTTLTVLGFLIAFHTGTLNWKAQALAQIKQHVASEIESFYTEASRLTIDAKIYVDSLVKAASRLQSQGASNEAVFDVHQALQKAAQFRATRDRLSAMSVEVHRITGRHYSVLSTVWGAIDTLEECASAFSQITQKMWVHVPIVLDGHPNPLSEFLAQVNIAECDAFSECCDRNLSFINGNSGGVRGLLLAPVAGFNLASLMSLSGKKALLTEAMQKARKRS